MKRNFLTIIQLAVICIAISTISCRNANTQTNNANAQSGDSLEVAQVDQDPSVPQLELLHTKSFYMLGKSDLDVSSKQFDLSGFGLYNC
ncbi:MAG: hypothetical protein J6U21_03245, partial [Bacteroidales bacterium]|nr:hypothetical protein [Bacteroidales bacterium]